MTKKTKQIIFFIVLAIVIIALTIGAIYLLDMDIIKFLTNKTVILVAFILILLAGVVICRVIGKNNMRD